MTDTIAETPTRVIDARGSFCPGPLMELIRGIRESTPGTVLSVYSSDSGSFHNISSATAIGTTPPTMKMLRH